jgi:tRNA/rRNA methyltransferase
VLVNTRNPLNIGAVARAMTNFGFLDLRLVKPYEASFREARSAVGAYDVMANAREYASVGEAVGDCVLVVGTTSADRREVQHSLYILDQAARLMHKRMRRGRVALLFGSEKRGLSNDDLSHCHRLLRIPTRYEHGSMNLGQAVAVCLYELRRQAGLPAEKSTRRGTQAKQNTVKLAAGDDLERITNLLLEALRLSGYLGVPVARRDRAGSSDEKIRRMVFRLALSAADAEVWQGMLRKMLWKMGNKA